MTPQNRCATTGASPARRRFWFWTGRPAGSPARSSLTRPSTTTPRPRAPDTTWSGTACWTATTWSSPSPTARGSAESGNGCGCSRPSLTTRGSTSACCGESRFHGNGPVPVGRTYLCFLTWFPSQLQTGSSRETRKRVKVETKRPRKTHKTKFCRVSGSRPGSGSWQLRKPPDGSASCSPFHLACLL